MNNLVPYQWSIKLETGEIYCIQASTAVELGLMIQEIKSKFLKTSRELNKEIMKDVPIENLESSENNPAWCDIHKLNMKERDGKYGKFFSHYIGVVPNGKWCSGQ